MKNPIILVLTIALSFFLIFCARPLDADKMLQDQKTRAEIFSAIMNDDVMMTEFIDHMQQNDHTMSMMGGHQPMMNRMMEDSTAFRQMLENDPQVRDRMMNMMMSNQPMMNQMINQMHNRGIISQECFDSMHKVMMGSN